MVALSIGDLLKARHFEFFKIVLTHLKFVYSFWLFIIIGEWKLPKMLLEVEIRPDYFFFSFATRQSNTTKMLPSLSLCIKTVVVIGQSNLGYVERSGLAPLTHVYSHIYCPHNPLYFTCCLAIQSFFKCRKHVRPGIFKV